MSNIAKKKTQGNGQVLPNDSAICPQSNTNLRVLDKFSGDTPMASGPYSGKVKYALEEMDKVSDKTSTNTDKRPYSERLLENVLRKQVQTPHNNTPLYYKVHIFVNKTPIVEQTTTTSTDNGGVSEEGSEENE